MASWMVHLRIADKLLDQLKDIDETAFVMGNIAPDSGVPNEDWTKFTPPKTVSHFNDGKYNASIPRRLAEDRLEFMRECTGLLPKL